MATQQEQAVSYSTSEADLTVTPDRLHGGEFGGWDTKLKFDMRPRAVEVESLAVSIGSLEPYKTRIFFEVRIAELRGNHNLLILEADGFSNSTGRIDPVSIHAIVEQADQPNENNGFYDFEKVDVGGQEAFVATIDHVDGAHCYISIYALVDASYAEWNMNSFKLYVLGD